jgi:hypothetical protein
MERSHQTEPRTERVAPLEEWARCFLLKLPARAPTQRGAGRRLRKGLGTALPPLTGAVPQGNTHTMRRRPCSAPRAPPHTKLGPNLQRRTVGLVHGSD